MGIAKAWARVRTDNHGRVTVPVVVTDHGPIPSLVRYASEAPAQTQRLKHLRTAVHAFLRFVEVNADAIQDPKTLYRQFAERLVTGTIQNDGTDPTGLYWSPARVQTARTHLSALTYYLDWWYRDQPHDHPNPTVEASGAEARIAHAAWWHRTQQSFLGHLRTNAFRGGRTTRDVQGRRRKVGAAGRGEAAAFPEDLILPCLRDGLGGADDPRGALRNQLIVLLMHYGGLRVSEPLHLFVQDVQPDPRTPKTANVRVYHPTDGLAPDGWRSRTGARHRAAYLAEKFGRRPRTEEPGQLQAGWKSPVHAEADQAYLQVYWFPPEMGEVWMRLWKTYLAVRAQVPCNHPFAFISFSPKSYGTPLTKDAFVEAYEAGLRRIGEAPSQPEGRNPHGHRHAYGRRLTDAGVDPLVRKQALHHQSLHSQLPYTEPGADKVTRSLSAAVEDIPTGRNAPASLASTGFADIDPEGLLSGPHPRL